jgi:hypothetical protein
MILSKPGFLCNGLGQNEMDAQVIGVVVGTGMVVGGGVVVGAGGVVVHGVVVVGGVVVVVKQQETKEQP